LRTSMVAIFEQYYNTQIGFIDVRVFDCSVRPISTGCSLF